MNKLILIVLVALGAFAAVAITRQKQAAAAAPVQSGFTGASDPMLLPQSVRTQMQLDRLIAQTGISAVSKGIDWLSTKMSPYDVNQYDYTEGGTNEFTLL
jgi:hypothetical protein